MESEVKWAKISANVAYFVKMQKGPNFAGKHEADLGKWES